MKKIFYIHILLVLACLVAECMYNTTSVVPYNKGSLMPSMSSYNSMKTAGVHYISPGSSYSGACNRTERRAQGQRKKALTLEERAKHISKKIDRQFIGDNDGCCNAITKIFHRQYTVMLSKSEEPHVLIQKLSQIDFDIERNPTVIPVLMEKSDLFRRLVENLIASYSRAGMIKGSTVDAFFDEPESMFPDLSRSLSCYIGKKVRANIIAQYDTLFNQVRPPFHEKRDLDFDWEHMYTSVKTLPEIHRIEMLADKCSINKNSIYIAHDNEYIKATDTSGQIIIWDTSTGERCYDVDENEIDWIKKEVYESHHRDYQHVVSFDGDDEYHVSFCRELSHDYSGCIKSKIPMLYLYKQPTLRSWLAQMALFNSIKNTVELDELLRSDTAKHLKGFPKNNLKRAIENQKKLNKI